MERSSNSTVVLYETIAMSKPYNPLKWLVVIGFGLILDTRDLGSVHRYLIRCYDETEEEGFGHVKFTLLCLNG